MGLSKDKFVQPGAWAIIWCKASSSVLMAKRSAKGRSGGVWNFFGGRIDSKEDPRTALVRELSEEAGLSVKAKKLVKLKRLEASKSDSRKNAKSRDLFFYLLTVDKELAPRLNHEHSDFFWFKQNKLPQRFNRPTSIAIDCGVLDKARARH
ncbi:MAG: NUDIX hydrolase [Rhodocyclaceae bacterium]|nr:NUDIX hydrolase [Rhodocyclaceae bacterium]